MKSLRFTLPGKRCCGLGLTTVLALGWPAAQAFTVSISAGTRELYLQVGVGGIGALIGSNTIVNTASVTVPATALGSGAAQVMATDSTATTSKFDGRAFCSSPATTGQVYVGGFYRVPGTTEAAASLTVSTPPSLTNATGDTIPFSSIAWTSSGIGDATPTIPNGTFTGTGENLLSVTRNTWFESCLAFRYLNTRVVPAGTFTGRATFTLTAP